MAGNTPRTDTGQHPIVNTNLVTRANRTKVTLAGLVVFMDIIMLMLAFWLGYAARQYVPLLAIPESQPTFTDYIPTMFLHVVLIILVFYISRLYHQPRAISRIDNARNVIGAVTTGAVLAFGLQELLFKNSALEIEYPRGIFFYAWILSALLAVSGRETPRLACP
jgi:FlaA1/EpsC-like NDP-sugar epimerase